MTYAPTRAHLATPIGIVEIFGDDALIDGITIHPQLANPTMMAPPKSGALAAAAEQLQGYFSGTRRAFDLPLAPANTTRGSALRAAIASVAYGTSATYGQLARAHASSSRAMGQACARNPFPIVIPCHRVTSSGGAKENYSGGDGAATKAWLTAHEARVAGKTLL
ncbi:MAG: methylated-DNA--[protein]-cysteine S-methyltransferase [Sphingopyxis sp.]